MRKTRAKADGPKRSEFRIKMLKRTSVGLRIKRAQCSRIWWGQERNHLKAVSQNPLNIWGIQ